MLLVLATSKLITWTGTDVYGAMSNIELAIVRVIDHTTTTVGTLVSTRKAKATEQDHQYNYCKNQDCNDDWDRYYKHGRRLDLMAGLMMSYPIQVIIVQVGVSHLLKEVEF